MSAVTNRVASFAGVDQCDGPEGAMNSEPVTESHGHAGHQLPVGRSA